MSNLQFSAVQNAPSRPSHLRQANARGLLYLLRTNNPCSKADLVRLSGLSAPTVSSGIAHLETLGLVEFVGDGESSGGRPPVMLRFNASHGYVVAADIGGSRLRMMLADLNGEIVTHWSTVLLKGQKTPDAVCALIQEGICVMCESSGVARSRLMNITAGAPGVTDVDTGVVISAPNLKDWNNVPLRELLSRETHLPAIVENDTNLAAVGEYHRGAAKSVENFVFIAIGTGVGAGIFLRGQLHHGAQWCAGEIGYFGVSGQERKRMQLRHTGQLERRTGGAGIEAQWQALLELRNSSANAELMRLRADQIFDLARDGDPLAIEVLNYTAGLLADAVADISLLLNPELVVFGGGIGSHPELCTTARKLVQRHEFAQPELRSSALGTRAQLFGAVSVSIAAATARLIP
jgi:glucokinase